MKEISHAKVYQGEYLAQVNVESIINNPLQPRLHIGKEELHDLAKSIEQHELI